MANIKIDPTKVYSAKEAMKCFKEGTFNNEAELREYLREDMTGKNIFNAKTYTMKSQTRFVIRGVDLAKGIVQFTKSS
jgi:hypothetical protein